MDSFEEKIKGLVCQLKASISKDPRITDHTSPIVLAVTFTLPSKIQLWIDQLTSLQNDLFVIKQWKSEIRPNQEELLELCQGATGIICILTDSINEDFLTSVGRELKVVSTMSVGYDHIDVASCNRLGIKVGITPGVLTGSTADITLLLILGAIRRAKEGILAVSEGKWGPWNPTWMLGYEFVRKTIGIIGLGRIGIAVAARTIPLGISKILYTTRSSDIGSDVSDNLQQIKAACVAMDQLNNKMVHSALGNSSDTGLEVQKSSLETLLSESDIVVITCNLSDSTYHMINSSNIKLMKKSAVLVNSARGPIVDNNALAEALSSGTIFAAGLDVTQPEPIPANHSLTSHPNCFILPHLGSATQETRTKMAALALINCISGVLGIELAHSA
ncbi:Glyoxylate reductase/hydroxypyruvate reductase [Smittium culicis]|uniref:Glyoxylate reductase/hydroxypyruvate reductase n=1 Tax=Smittium culicis TaxID=133412 RepID=A0A1R1Y7I1_9FUNG|nr:Glyoxylate reductase/hydroxypyruvate reductase [Smittium culicis]